MCMHAVLCSACKPTHVGLTCRGQRVRLNLGKDEKSIQFMEASAKPFYAHRHEDVPLLYSSDCEEFREPPPNSSIGFQRYDRLTWSILVDLIDSCSTRTEACAFEVVRKSALSTLDGYQVRVEHCRVCSVSHQQLHFSLSAPIWASLHPHRVQRHLSRHCYAILQSMSRRSLLFRSAVSFAAGHQHATSRVRSFPLALGLV